MCLPPEIRQQSGLTDFELSPHVHRHQCHGVVAEDVDHLHRNRVAALAVVGVHGRGQVKVAALAGAEALPLVLEDVAARPPLLELGQLQRKRPFLPVTMEVRIPL